MKYKLPRESNLEDYQDIYYINGNQRILLLSDTHIGNQDNKSIEIAIKYGKKFKPTIIILNGDILEASAVSFYRKKPGLFLENEIIPVRQFMEYIRHNFPKAKILYKIGNHESRLTNFLQDNAQALYGLSCLSWESLFKADEYNIKIIQAHQFIKYKNIYIIHGSEVKVSGKDICKKMTIKLPFKNIIFSHFHKIDYHRYNDEENNIYDIYATGCLCNLKPDWLRINNWETGFLSIDGDKVCNFKIINDKIH